MTNQEAFTIVVQHLRTQGAPSRVTDPDRDGYWSGKCLYRHPDGIRRCAVGILIPDTQYSRSFERWLLRAVVRRVPALHRLDLDLLTDLQLAHDRHYGIEWRTAMEDAYVIIAKKYNLIVPPHPCQEEPVYESNQSCRESQAGYLTQSA